MAEAAARRGAALSIDTAVRRTEAVYHELARWPRRALTDVGLRSGGGTCATCRAGTPPERPSPAATR